MKSPRLPVTGAPEHGNIRCLDLGDMSELRFVGSGGWALKKIEHSQTVVRYDTIINDKQYSYFHEFDKTNVSDDEWGAVRERARQELLNQAS